MSKAVNKELKKTIQPLKNITVAKTGHNCGMALFEFGEYTKTFLQEERKIKDVKKIKELICEYKKRKYYKKRAKNWKEFKEQSFELRHNLPLQCELVDERLDLEISPFSWECYCWGDECYSKEFFEKYGCRYVKGFNQE